MGDSLRGVDGLAVTYLTGSALLLLLGGMSEWEYLICLGLHVVAAVGIVLMSRARSLPPVLRVVRQTYPLLLLLLLYVEVDLLVRVVHDSSGFDPLVQEWDQWLFGGHPHEYLAQWLSGRGWAELFHFLYLSYYVFLIGAFLGVRWLRPRAFPRFAFVVTGMFVSFVGIFVAFPVTGPLTESGVSFMTAGLFPGLVAQVYAPLAVDGIHAGAFPSSHVGMSVGIAFLLAPRRWWMRLALSGLVLGIAVATVYGRFHYAIDAVAGLLAGGGLYLLWAQIYKFLQSKSTPALEVEERTENIEPASASAALSQRNR